MGSYLTNLAFSMMNKTGNLLLSPPVGGGFGQFRNHGPRDQRKVAITFDDGPSVPCTTELLDAMADLDVKGTFFCVGQNTAMNPDVVARAFAEGHTIGNHSMAHRRMTSIRPTGGDHIDQGAEEIRKVIGCMPRLYRPPWGWLTPWEGRRLHQRGYTIVGWDVYTLDWRIPEPDGREVAAGVCRDTKPGSILLFHDAYPGAKHWKKSETTRAIQTIVPALRAQGYEFVTIPELFNIPAYASAPTTQSPVID